MSFPRADRPGTPRSNGASEADESVEALAGALVPPTPPQAERLFGPATVAAEHYARLLAGPAVARGLIGPHEVPRLWERHLLNSAAVAELVPHPGSLVDLGSGAGLPGIVLALLLPDVVTARAVAPLDRLAALALGLARPGGTVLAIKGANASQEVAAARPALDRLGVRGVDVVCAGDGKVDPATTVVRLTAGP